MASCTPYCVLSLAQLPTNSVVRHFGEARMRPAVIRDFMSFSRLSRYDFGIFRNVLADQEKRGFDVMSGEQIEQLWCQFRAWPVIERHCDVKTIDVDPIESDPGFGRRGGLGLFVTLRRSRVGVNSGNARQSKKIKKEITKHQDEFLRLRQTSLYLAEAECNARCCGSMSILSKEKSDSHLFAEERPAVAAILLRRYAEIEHARA